MKFFRGYLLILCATLFWGLSATVAKFLFNREIDTFVLVQTRMTFSCIVLLIIFLLFKPGLLRVKLKHLHRFAFLGIIGGAGSNYTYYYTIRETNVATAILLQYMAPLFVLAYSAIAREEELSTVKIAAGIVSLAGCFFAVAGSDFSLVKVSRAGLIAGVGSALCWSFANVWLRHVLKEYRVWTTLIYAFIFATVFWMFFNPPWQLFSEGYDAETWGVFFGFALISILIPHTLYFLGMQHLVASRAIITATSEPIFAILLAYLFLGEILAPIQVAGALLVIAAIIILQFRREAGQDILLQPHE